MTGYCHSYIFRFCLLTLFVFGSGFFFGIDLFASLFFAYLFSYIFLTAIQLVSMADAQVTAWLRCAGLSRFAPRFGAALISAETFVHLSSTDLDALGVDGPADRKRLNDLIADLRRASDPSSRRHSTARASTLHAIRSSDPRSILESFADRHSSTTTHALVVSKQSSRDISTITRRQSSRFPVAATTSSFMTSSATSREPPATVTVCVRKRPLSRKELHAGDRDIVTVSHEEGSLHVHELKEKVDLTKYVETHSFSFDNVFGEHVGNKTVYEGTARPLVDCLFSGGRGTCFAYGQTGAGKTFTMAGDGEENPGLYTLAVREVFDRIRGLERDAWREAEEKGVEDFDPPDLPQVWISFYEIYGTRLQDLLNRGAKLECREDSNSEVQIVGLSERLCEVEEDVLDLVKSGSALRSTGVTGANDDSSRSHAVFQIELREPMSSTVNEDENIVMRESLLRGTKRTLTDVKRGDEIGRLCFIDLAGSERGSDTSSSTRQTRMEGAEINKSLLALKECIRAMDKRKDHTPFRGSKLTQVLKASFLGKNCRTVMIANISPASSNVEHTLNTLRYSDRVKEIKKERGNRRTTMAPGANLGNVYGVRAGRNLHSSQPMLSKMNSPSTDCDVSDDAPTSTLQVKVDRKLITMKGESDFDDASSNGLSITRPPARRLTRAKGTRGSEHSLAATHLGVTSDSNGSSRTRDPRLMRRRASKAPTDTILPRPSLATSMLPRGPSASKGSSGDGLPRANSGTSVRSSELNYTKSEVDEAAESLERVAMRQGRNRSREVSADAKRVASPALTRQRARERKGKLKDDKASESPSDSHEDSPVEDKDRRRLPGARRKPSPVSNVAESAMKYYMGRHKKEELPEEDLLFASTEDLTESVDTISKRRLIVASKDSKRGEDEQAKIPPKPIYGGDRDTRLPRAATKFAQQRDASSSSNESDSSNENSCGKGLSPEVRQVIRMHHMQIEELMRLTEADVALVNAVEKGNLDAQEYALKLSVNISQKLDIVRTLQLKLKVLD